MHYSKKYLDSITNIFYSHNMAITNLLTRTQVLKAAWRHTAVAEGEFY